MIALKMPLEFMQPEAVVEPAIATMCASHVVQGKASGVTYMGDGNHLHWSGGP